MGSHDGSRRPGGARPLRTGRGTELSGDRTPGSRVSDYDYELPSDRIARYPTDRRDESRLLVVPPDGAWEHRVFRSLAELMAPGDLLIVNDSRVVPARFLGRKRTGAAAEVLLVRQSDEDETVWDALVRPGNKVKTGAVIEVAPDLSIEVLDVLPSGSRRVRLSAGSTVEEAIERHGHMPLPPYIDRPDERVDRTRYQTVYADRDGSVAAPTAGLHFTDELLSRIEGGGVRIGRVTLHVGIGTFRPVEGDDPAEHRMHAEWYEVSEEVARVVNDTRASGGRIWAVGTTSVRTLESVADAEGVVHAGSGETTLFIRPSYRFRVVDALVTNFHLPRSTLLMLVSALAGYDRTMSVYRAAVAEGYRFYSYGDAMVVLPTRR